MNELVRIIKTIDSTPGPMCLATVVDVVGSAYRRPTARMLILPDGSHVGSISGGCLERDLCRSAIELTEGGPRLVSFDTRHDSTEFNPRYNVGRMHLPIL
ncbi:MAG: XdhC family protein [Planctomycetota bacterium]